MKFVESLRKYYFVFNKIQSKSFTVNHFRYIIIIRHHRSLDTLIN